eukprot:403347193
MLSKQRLLVRVGYSIRIHKIQINKQQFLKKLIRDPQTLKPSYVYQFFAAHPDLIDKRTIYTFFNDAIENNRLTFVKPDDYKNSRTRLVINLSETQDQTQSNSSDYVTVIDHPDSEYYSAYELKLQNLVNLDELYILMRIKQQQLAFQIYENLLKMNKVRTDVDFYNKYLKGFKSKINENNYQAKFIEVDPDKENKKQQESKNEEVKIERELQDEIGKTLKRSKKSSKIDDTLINKQFIERNPNSIFKIQDLNQGLTDEQIMKIEKAATDYETQFKSESPWVTHEKDLYFYLDQYRDLVKQIDTIVENQSQGRVKMYMKGSISTNYLYAMIYKYNKMQTAL